MDVIYASQRLDDFVVRFVFFEFLALNRKFYRIHAKPRIDKRRVEFDVVYAHTQLSQSGHKRLQIVFVAQFKVQFKVVRALFQVFFKCREKLQKM